MRKTLLLTALALTTGIALGSLAARLNAQPAAGALAAFQRVQADAIERLKNIKISGDPDRDFASLLISNHEEGLFLARSELEFGGDQQLREAAQKISETRQKQVDELKEWLARHSEVANNRKLAPPESSLSGPPVGAFPSTPTAEAPAAASSAADLPLVKGRVEDIDSKAGKVTIEHEAIPNLNMEGMTMVFRVADPAALKALKKGQAVRFTADRTNGQLTVRSIQKGN